MNYFITYLITPIDNVLTNYFARDALPIINITNASVMNMVNDVESAYTLPTVIAIAKTAAAAGSLKGAVTVIENSFSSTGIIPIVENTLEKVVEQILGVFLNNNSSVPASTTPLVVESSTTPVVLTSTIPLVDTSLVQVQTLGNVASFDTAVESTS